MQKPFVDIREWRNREGVDYTYVQGGFDGKDIKFSLHFPVKEMYGGSGGAYKTIECVENCSSWDGVVPYVNGAPVSVPHNLTIRAHAMRVFRHKFPDIINRLKKDTKITSQLEEAKNGTDNVPILYQRFLGLANAFDTASNEQKKMIICGLCDRIEVSRDYEVRIVVDMDYGQFCG